MILDVCMMHFPARGHVEGIQIVCTYIRNLFGLSMCRNIYDTSMSLEEKTHYIIFENDEQTSREREREQSQHILENKRQYKRTARTRASYVVKMVLCLGKTAQNNRHSFQRSKIEYGPPLA
jgi:hypothetical protein